MESVDGAEICELIGLFILDSLKKRLGINFGLYRDDGLGVPKTSSGRLADRTWKEITTFFENYVLKITVQANLMKVNFIDITFDLTNGTYKPYKKPNDEPL